MKICFVSKEVAGLRGGGIGTYVAEAAKALSAHGHEVWLLTADPGEDQRALLGKLPGFHRVLVTGANVPQDARRKLYHGAPHYAYSWLVHQSLMRLGERFDYIEFADYEAEGFVPFKEQKLFCSYGDTALGLMMHSPTWECFAYDGQAHRADLRMREVCNLEEAAIRDAPALASPSAGLRDEVLSRLGIARDVAILRYPMELPDELPEPPAPRRQLADLDFLYFGRIEPRKGIAELIEAFRRMPELSIELIGGDVPYSPYGRSLREYLGRRAPSNVRFAEPMPRERLLERVRHADVCVFPSLFENWPNTCIEAMAAGRVVIGSAHGGMREMIEHGVSGFHVDGRSADDIERVIRDELGAALDRLPEIGRAAARRMRGFSSQRTYAEALVARARELGQAAAARVPVPPTGQVSIIVPFYRDRDTIDEAIDSALAQTWQDLEVLIVADGSPLPDADEILGRQAAKDPRIRVLRKPNGGLGSARNHGIEHARGDFLLFLDADNVLRPEYARTALEALANAPDAGWIVPFCRMFASESGETRGIYNPMPFDPKASLLINRFGDAGAFFRRSIFDEHRYDEVLIAYEDWALWLELATEGKHGEIVPRELYDYRVREDSMMAQDGLPNHPALMGLLIHEHAGFASPAEKDLLTTVFATAGQSIMRVLLGHPDHAATRPGTSPAPAAAGPKSSAARSELSPAPTPAPPVPSGASLSAAERTVAAGEPAAPKPLRYEIVDALSAASKRVPWLNSMLRALLGLVPRRRRPIGPGG